MSTLRCNCSPGCAKLDGRRHYFSPTTSRIDRLLREVQTMRQELLKS